jgi:hypothetical protein
MMPLSRRSLLSAFSVALPAGLGNPLKASAVEPAPLLRFISFEDAVRAAFAVRSSPEDAGDSPLNYRRIEVGHSEMVQAGVQGGHNDRPFAGFPAGHLRIVRVGFEPGPVRQGVRLYSATVDVLRTDGLSGEVPSRPLDFGSLPAAPTFS